MVMKPQVPLGVFNSLARKEIRIFREKMCSLDFIDSLEDFTKI